MNLQNIFFIFLTLYNNWQLLFKKSQKILRAEHIFRKSFDHSVNNIGPDTMERLSGWNVTGNDNELSNLCENKN